MTEEPDPEVGISASKSVPRSQPVPEQEIPAFKVLYVADLTPANKIEDWSKGQRVTAVNKNSFTDLMENYAGGTSITIDIPNRLAPSPGSLEPTLTFGSMNDFKPSEVALRVPSLNRLLSVRHLLGEAGRGSLDAEEFRDGLASLGIDGTYADQLYEALFGSQEGGVSTLDGGSAAGGASSLDRLLSMVDLNETADSSAREQNPILSGLIDAIRSPEADAAVDRKEARRLIGELDGLIGAQVAEIFRHPAYRELESAWRGLKFLVDRFDFRSGLQLEVLACDRESLNEALYRQVLLREFSDDPPQVPVSLIVLDFSFSQSLDDVERLEDLATSGASMQTPIVAALSPKFFGKDDDRELNKLPLISQHVEGPEFIQWNKLRDLKESEYLCLALPGFLLREAFSEGANSGTANFNEEEGLWGRASLAVGAAVGDSYAQTGWPTTFIGRSIEDLPVGSVSGGSTPLATLIPEDKIVELAKAGLTVLGGKSNSDAISVARANTVIKPEISDNLVARTAAQVHATLPARLFIARAAHFLVALQNSVASGDNPAATLETLKRSLRSLMRSRGQTAPQESVSVEHVPEAKLPNDELWAVKLRAHRGILPREVSAVMGLTTKGKYTSPHEPASRQE